MLAKDNGSTREKANFQIVLAQRTNLVINADENVRGGHFGNSQLFRYARDAIQRPIHQCSVT